MRLFLLLALLALFPASAQAMNVATFLTKAEALKKKGMASLFSSDMKLLKGEIQSQSLSLKTEREAAAKAGRPQAYCPPQRASLNSDEILAAFHAIPPVQQARVEVREALKALLTRKYPCR